MSRLLRSCWRALPRKQQNEFFMCRTTDTRRMFFASTRQLDTPIEIQHPTSKEFGADLSASEKRKIVRKSGAVISIFDMFSIGVGPSSSHTVGPMRAAKAFVDQLQTVNKIDLKQVGSVHSELYGSLACTGDGHGTPQAILMGLEGNTPENVVPERIIPRSAEIRTSKKMVLGGVQPIEFENSHIAYHRKEVLPLHSNGMRFIAYSKEKQELASAVWYSIGGGFIINGQNPSGEDDDTKPIVPFPFTSCQDILETCAKHNITFAQLVMENEKTWRSEDVIRNHVLRIWNTMESSIERGCTNSAIYLPGPLKVKRRAPSLYQKLKWANAGNEVENVIDQHNCQNMQKERKSKKMVIDNNRHAMEWLSLFAIAVNEENAGGGRIVTAPTNGAAGVLPATLKYYKEFLPDRFSDDGVIEFLLTAGAIGMLFKSGASISAAEVGCQGEIGVACSMAAAALTAVMGGTPYQIECSAEMGIEHNLGLTCDPIGGLVQIPCIERNAMGSVKALNCSLLSLQNDSGQHIVTLDQAIKTMWQTGKDMQTKYKETSEGGLAINVGINVPDC